MTSATNYSDTDIIAKHVVATNCAQQSAQQAWSDYKRGLTFGWIRDISERFKDSPERKRVWKNSAFPGG